MNDDKTATEEDLHNYCTKTDIVTVRLKVNEEYSQIDLILKKQL